MGAAAPRAVEAGGRFTARDGSIDGSFVTLEPGVRIVRSWRSDDFPAGAIVSLLEARSEGARKGSARGEEDDSHDGAEAGPHDGGEEVGAEARGGC